VNGLCVRRRGRGRDCAPAALDWALLGGPSTSPLDAMALSASTVAALVDAQLAGISDPAVRDLITRLRVEPRRELRPWNYGAPGQYPCWIVLAYCAQGFGPRAPWGLLRLTSHLSMGDDSGWFASLEEAVRDSPVSRDLGHVV
jgi:hypothetical protein